MPLTFAERTFTNSVAASFALSQDEKSPAEVKAKRIKKGNLTELFILRFVRVKARLLSQGILLNTQPTIYYFEVALRSHNTICIKPTATINYCIKSRGKAYK